MNSDRPALGHFSNESLPPRCQAPASRASKRAPLPPPQSSLGASKSPARSSLTTCFARGQRPDSCRDRWRDTDEGAGHVVAGLRSPASAQFSLHFSRPDASRQGAGRRRIGRRPRVTRAERVASQAAPGPHHRPEVARLSGGPSGAPIVPPIAAICRPSQLPLPHYRPRAASLASGGPN